MHTPVIIDVEASAMGVGSYPIEVGFVLSCGTPFCTLIKPDLAWNLWDAAAERTHGIRRETLYMYGQTVASVAAMLNERLAGLTVYSDAWSYDAGWLSLLFDAADSRQRFRIESLRALLSEEQAGIWHAVKERVAVEQNLKRHRASGDARILQMTFLRTREIIEQQLAGVAIAPSRYC